MDGQLEFNLSSNSTLQSFMEKCCCQQLLKIYK